MNKCPNCGSEYVQEFYNEIDGKYWIKCGCGLTVEQTLFTLLSRIVERINQIQGLDMREE